MSAFARTAGWPISFTNRASSWTSLSSACSNGSSSRTISRPFDCAYSPASLTISLAMSQIASFGKTSQSQ